MILKLIQAVDATEKLIPKADPLSGGLIDGGSGNFNIILGIFSFITSSSFLAFLGRLWDLYTIVAYIISIIFIVLYVYASVRRNHYIDLQDQEIRDGEKLYREQIKAKAKSSQLDDIVIHSNSENPNDWRLAIIEADIILDNALKKQGYAGTSLGERLKSISSEQMSSLEDAWEAHKVRNRIAHEGADFVLTRRIVDETIARYQRVFAEIGII